MLEKGVLGKKYKFLDAFSGTGSVSKVLAEDFEEVIVNDNLESIAWYSKSNIQGNIYDWKNLGFDPIQYLNNQDLMLEGFIYQNYAPGESGRMYFTDYNAKRIDYIRSKIQEWYDKGLISEEEKHYLISCLIEAVSKIANVAGVYGAFLKKWDQRANKAIQLSHFKPQKISSPIIVNNDLAEKIVSNVEHDVLYLDPPYTQNQYGTQYHLLETISKYDSPSVSKVTGSRPTSPMRSGWSKDISAHILLDKILSSTKAEHVFISYSSDGIMSKDYIISSLKRYGVEGSLDYRVIPYKFYSNWKSTPRSQHEEYIFYVKLKAKHKVRYQSPLNYTGNKYLVIDQIIDKIPADSKTFVDVFGGGFNVGINVKAESIVYNDINHFVVSLMMSFREIDTYEYIKYIRRIEKKFNLSKDSSEGYLLLRDYYNSKPWSERDPRILFVLTMYGFNQQIRFNKNYEFNNPVGIRWFNDRMLEKFISFSRKIKEQNVLFYNLDFSELLKAKNFDEAFYYFDPPYLLTTGSYNDGKRGFKGWDKCLEKEFFEMIVDSSFRDLWLLSYVIEHKGEFNEYFVSWLQRTGFEFIEIENVRGHGGSVRNEVLVSRK